MMKLRVLISVFFLSTMALLQAKEEVMQPIFGDSYNIVWNSQTAISYIEGNIKDKPRTKEQFLNHKHCEFWAAQIRRRGVKAIKIKAHEKTFQVHSIGNRLADLLANESRAKFYSR